LQVRAASVTSFFGIGALVTRTLWLDGMFFPLAFLLSGLAAVAFATLIGVPTFRLRGAYFAIGTLGIAEVLRITVSQNLPLISTMTTAEIAHYDLTLRYYVALGLALATIGAATLLLRSSCGLGILAVREDEEAAQATRWNAPDKLLALFISSLFAGLGGLFAFQQISLLPVGGVQSSMDFRCAAHHVCRRPGHRGRAGARRDLFRVRARAISREPGTDPSNDLRCVIHHRRAPVSGRPDRGVAAHAASTLVDTA
jgi:hypothetical protein